jgi:uncharacterized protein YfdQ (DUF2303 family)
VSKEQSENQALIDHLCQEQPVQILKLTDANPRAMAAVIPPGKTLSSLKEFQDEWLEHPERATGTANISDLASFIEFTNRTKTPNTVIFANNDRNSPSFLAVFDYNQAVAAGGCPGWSEHRAEYKFPVSDEWKQWVGSHKRTMTQEAFAEWIEDRIIDVADPTLATDRTKEILNALGGVLLASQAKLLALSKGLSVHVKSELENAVNTSSGEANLVWKTEHQDATGSKLVVPGAFLIAIPLFRGGPSYPIIVRLRYRAERGQVTWSYLLYRTEEFFEMAIRSACAEVREQTSLPVIVGTPEVKADNEINAH